MSRDQGHALATAFVVGLGLGVLVMDVARERREYEAVRIAERAVAVAETYEQVCGKPGPVVIAEPRP